MPQQFESVEAMLRSSKGRAILLRWAGFGAGLGVAGRAALGDSFGPTAATLPFAALFGAFAGLGAWYLRERGRELRNDVDLGGPAEWEAEGRRLEELKHQAPHDPEAASAYVAQLESMVQELRDLRDHPPRGFKKLTLPVADVLATLERDLAEARSLRSSGAA